MRNTFWLALTAIALHTVPSCVFHPHFISCSSGGPAVAFQRKVNDWSAVLVKTALRCIYKKCLRLPFRSCNASGTTCTRCRMLPNRNHNSTAGDCREKVRHGMLALGHR
uniref:Putative secreted protein n=1 Tax=Anopheles marajoara TaxID=58244 RepID=A0A2M4C809_9DIPT